MEITQYQYDHGQWLPSLPHGNRSQLVLAFGSRAAMLEEAMAADLSDAFNQADIVGCTTSGEIFGDEVYDDTLVLTAIDFSNTQVRVVSENCNKHCDSSAVAKALAQQLPSENLRAVLVISDGQLVNGSELVAGLKQQLPASVLFSGGLAGDDDRFAETVVWHNQKIESGLVVLCGFYGDDLIIGHGSLGGWTTFGPDREITRADKNVLYELDGQPALDLYKRYLGDVAAQLPGAALRFPLNLTLPNEQESVVRTILSINEDEKSMVFAGNMPKGAKVQLMKASFDALIDGANAAAEFACTGLREQRPQLALLISCVGRRLVLGQRVFEELESVHDVIGDNCVMCGFYSYGEISPVVSSTECKLHNQTMTITAFSERKH